MQEPLNNQNDIQANDYLKYRFFKFVRENCALILTSTRVELYDVRSKCRLSTRKDFPEGLEFYKRNLIWYDRLDGIHGFELQAFDLQPQSMSQSRVLLVIANVLHIYLLSFQGKKLRSGQLIVKSLLIHKPNEQVYDAKFFQDMDISYTKTLIQDSRTVASGEAVNQYVYLKRTQKISQETCIARAALDLTAQPEDTKIMTKNFSNEPMKIQYCGNFLHMMLISSTRIELMCAAIYLDTIKLHQRSGQILKTVIAETPKRKSIKERVGKAALNLQANPELLSDPIYKLIIDGKHMEMKPNEHEVRNLSFKERFSDSLIADLNMLKVVHRRLDEEAYVRMMFKGSMKTFEEQEHDIATPIYRSHPTNTITEAHATNLHDSQRLLFLLEEGINPALLIVFCFQGSLRLEKSFDYCQLNRITQRHNFGGRKSFRNLLVECSDVWKSNEDAPLNYLVRVRNNKHGGTGNTSDYKLYQSVTVSDYKVSLYCPEDDSLIVLRFRCRHSVMYQVKDLDSQSPKFFELQQKKDKCKGLNMLRHELNFEGDGFEIIRKVGKNHLKEFPQNPRQTPEFGTQGFKRYETTTIANSCNVWKAAFKMKKKTEKTRMKDGSEKERVDYFADPDVELPTLATFADRGLWMDKNWFLKLVDLETVAEKKLTKLTWKLRELDLDVWEELDKQLHRRIFIENQQLGFRRAPRDYRTVEPEQRESRQIQQGDEHAHRGRRYHHNDSQVIIEDVEEEDAEQNVSSGYMNWNAHERSESSSSMQSGSHVATSQQFDGEHHVAFEESAVTVGEKPPEQSLGELKKKRKGEVMTEGVVNKTTKIDEYDEWKKKKAERKLNRQKKVIKLENIPEIPVPLDSDDTSSSFLDLDDKSLEILVGKPSNQKDVRITDNVLGEMSFNDGVLGVPVSGQKSEILEPPTLAVGLNNFLSPDCTERLDESNMSVFLVEDVLLDEQVALIDKPAAEFGTKTKEDTQIVIIPTSTEVKFGDVSFGGEMDGGADSEPYHEDSFNDSRRPSEYTRHQYYNSEHINRSVKDPYWQRDSIEYGEQRDRRYPRQRVDEMEMRNPPRDHQFGRSQEYDSRERYYEPQPHTTYERRSDPNKKNRRDYQQGDNREYYYNEHEQYGDERQSSNYGRTSQRGETHGMYGGQGYQYNEWEGTQRGGWGTKWSRGGNRY